MNPELYKEQKNKIEFFGVRCFIERPSKNTIKITCDSMEDARSIILRFWQKRNPEIDRLFDSGMLKPEQEITSGARTTIIEYQERVVVLITENDNPFSKETLSTLREGGFLI